MPERTPAAAYLRISQDREGLMLGVERQREDVLALAVQHGLDLPAHRILVENDTSASSRSKKKRPQYEALKAMVLSGEVKAVVFYSNSRLTRRAEELGDWIELHAKTGVRLHSKVSGDDDLGTADGRMVARIKASVDAAEAERISERVKRTFEQRRAAGQVATGGPRPFGFTGSHANATLIPEEAEAIRAGAKILLAGGTYGEIMRDWTRRGLKPVSAKGWTRDSIRGIYRSGRIAGLVTYQRKVVGPANGPAILDRAEWEAVQEAARHAPGRPPAARRHVLSGFVFCALCGATMVVQGASYVCVQQRQGCGGVKRNKPWLDALVDGYISEKVGAMEAVEAEPVSDARRGVIENLEARLSALRSEFEAGRVAPEDYFPSLSAMRGRVNELRKQEAEGARRAAVAGPARPTDAWQHGSLTVRRGIVAGLIAGIYVKPVGRIGRRPIPCDSVEIVPA